MSGRPYTREERQYVGVLVKRALYLERQLAEHPEYDYCAEELVALRWLRAEVEAARGPWPGPEDPVVARKLRRVMPDRVRRPR